LQLDHFGRVGKIHRGTNRLCLMVENQQLVHVSAHKE
jgi:hypothetical protein